MPYSDPDNKATVAAWLDEIAPVSVLDVGPGAGVYGEISRRVPSVQIVNAVEAWEPYIDQFNLTGIYDKVTVGDIRDHDNFEYDVVIFGDILEHMSADDALAVYSKALQSAKWVVFSIPIIHLPQDAYGGNPFEVHVEEDWSHEKILDWFPGIVKSETFRVTGVYLAHAS